MKKLILIAAIIGNYSFAEAQSSPDSTVSIPDSKFRAALIEDGVDTNGDLLIQASEASMVEKLDVSGEEIDSLKGIEAFKNLRKLTVSSNNLKTLNLWHNPLLDTLEAAQNKLVSLNIENNKVLKHLFIPINFLIELNLTNNQALRHIDANMNRLDTMDFSTNPELEIVLLDDNRLKSVNVSQNIDLYALSLSSNMLSEINLLKNDSLQFLSLNYNQLTVVDLSAQTKLERASLTNNPLQTVCVSAGFNTNVIDVGTNTNVAYKNCGTLTGLLDVQVKAEKLLYPNPAKDEVHFEENIENVLIFNSTGNLVLQGNAKGINISTLTQGVYHAKLTDKQGNAKWVKFIKE